MRKTIAILVVVALLGMLAAYELPPRAKKPATASVTSTQTQTTQNTAAAQSSGNSSSAAQASSSGLKDGTFTGTTETGFYDTIQVAITVSGGKITAVNTPVLSGDSGHSDSTNSYAVPQLNQEVLSTQSAQIDGISGASYTTQTYTQSLQSAIDQAKA